MLGFSNRYNNMATGGDLLGVGSLTNYLYLFIFYYIFNLLYQAVGGADETQQETVQGKDFLLISA